MFFKLTYDIMVEDFNLSLADMINLQFTAEELKTIDFNLHRIIEVNSYFTKEIFFLFKIKYESWKNILGLNEEICTKLEIKPSDVSKIWPKNAIKEMNLL
jgi:hypothetical protein